MECYNPFSLEGKTILITGAAGGIGGATAIECAKLGASLILTDINEEGLANILGKLEKPDLHRYVVANLTNDDEINNLVDGIEKQPYIFQHDGAFLVAGFFQLFPFQSGYVLFQRVHRPAALDSLR